MHSNNLYQIKAQNGKVVSIPIDVVDQTDTYLGFNSEKEIKEYYDEHGYVVFRNLIPKELCDASLSAFRGEVKNFSGYIYRQATANLEKHKFTEYGYMLNSILNIQDIRTDLFPKFKDVGLKILTHKKMQNAVEVLLGEAGKLVQSMFFEGNPATWAHQDTYYLDSENVGNMTAAWVAVEDIQPGAGRFFVYPGSHKIDIKKNGGDFDIAFNHSKYKQLIIDIIGNQELCLVAPALRKGDVLFWTSKTIHGSLDTTQPQYSRSSFTAHFIPRSHQFLQYQSKIKQLNLKNINNLLVNHPKNQDEIIHRFAFAFETYFPKTFQSIKRIAIKMVTK